MVHNEYGIRVSLSVRGEQDTAVSVLEGPGRNGTPVVQVRTGPVLTYVNSLTACTVAATAWAQARAVAPAAFAVPSIGPVDVLADAACQLTLTGTPAWNTTGQTAASAHDRIACVWVQVGPLTVRALDADSVTCLASAWARAELLAGVAFTDDRRRRQVRAKKRNAD